MDEDVNEFIALTSVLGRVLDFYSRHKEDSALARTKWNGLPLALRTTLSSKEKLKTDLNKSSSLKWQQNSYCFCGPSCLYGFINTKINISFLVLPTGWPESGHLDRCVPDNCDVCWAAGCDCGGHPPGRGHGSGVDESPEWESYLGH